MAGCACALKKIFITLTDDHDEDLKRKIKKKTT